MVDSQQILSRSADVVLYTENQFWILVPYVVLK